MIWMGLVGMIECRRLGLQRQFTLSFFALMVVGIGSVLFHGTLAYSAQLADELPMILGSLVFVYQMWDLLVTQKLQRWNFCIPEWMTVSLLVGYGALTTLMMAMWTHSPLPMNLSYMFMVVFIIAASVKLYRDSTHSMTRRFFELALVCYLFACGCWMTEKYFCEQGMPVTQYLHAMWHLGAGFGTYTFLQWTSFLKAHSLKYNPQVAFRSLLPVVVMGPNTPHTQARESKTNGLKRAEETSVLTPLRPLPNTRARAKTSL